MSFMPFSDSTNTASEYPIGHNILGRHFTPREILVKLSLLRAFSVGAHRRVRLLLIIPCEGLDIAYILYISFAVLISCLYYQSLSWSVVFVDCLGTKHQALDLSSFELTTYFKSTNFEPTHKLTHKPLMLFNFDRSSSSDAVKRGFDLTVEQLHLKLEARPSQ